MRNWRSKGLAKIGEGRKRDESADIQLMKKIEELAIQAGLREEAEIVKIPSQIKIELESKAAEEDVLKADGSRELTNDWDIGEDRSILAERFDARDTEGLRLYSEDGGTYFWVFNNGIMSREVDGIATFETERYDTTPAPNQIGAWMFRARDTLGNTCSYATIKAYSTDVVYDSKDGLLRFDTMVDGQTVVYMTMTEGKVGIGTGIPDKKLEVKDSSAEQLRLTHTAGSICTDFRTDGSGDLTISPSGNKVLVAKALEVDGAFDHDGSTLGVFGVAPASRAAAYTVSNATEDRAFDADSTTVDELADVMATIINDLKSYGLFQ